jgi:manganese oxidase
VPAGTVVLTGVRGKPMPLRGRVRLLVLGSIAVAWASFLVLWSFPWARGSESFDPCAAQTMEPPETKTFAVSLINVPLFLNRFGDVVPEGRMYVLDENIDEVRASFRDAADPFHPHDLIEPLVLRVHKHKCVEITFTNRLHEPAPNFNRDDSIFTLPGEQVRAAGTVTPEPRAFAPARTQPDIDFDPGNAPPASMHFAGLRFSVETADGAAAGNNANTTVAPGASRTYRLYSGHLGEFNFQDGADLSSVADRPDDNFIGSNAFGAFGADHHREARHDVGRH